MAATLRPAAHAAGDRPGRRGPGNARAPVLEAVHARAPLTVSPIASQAVHADRLGSRRCYCASGVWRTVSAAYCRRAPGRARCLWPLPTHRKATGLCRRGAPVSMFSLSLRERAGVRVPSVLLEKRKLHASLLLLRIPLPRI